MTDYSFWDREEWFVPQDAAQLWLDVDPGSALEKPDEIKFHIIHSAIIRRLERGAGKIHRTALLSMAEERGERPRFLYPSERTADPAGNPLSTKERNTLLVIIAALCEKAGVDYRQRGIAKSIAGLTADIDCPVSVDTIREFLNQIPDAIERRSK